MLHENFFVYKYSYMLSPCLKAYSIKRRDVPCWHVRSEFKTVVLPMTDAELQLFENKLISAIASLPVPSATSQLFQGKVSSAVDTCSRAVDLCQEDKDNTPDTDALGQVGDQSRVICDLRLQAHSNRLSQV